MKVTVLYFASVRDQTGIPSEEVELADGATLGTLIEDVTTRFETLGAMKASLMLSVNQDYADASTVLNEGDEVALIPPVSGGSCGDRGRPDP